MSSGWNEDPELAQLRNSVEDQARSKIDQAGKVKREMDSFVERYQPMISGGVTQAADVLRASRRYDRIALNEPRVWPILATFEWSYRWEVKSEARGDYLTPLTVHIYARRDPTGNHLIIDIESRKRGEWMAGDDSVNARILLSEFSEQWFRENLRKCVRHLVS